MNCPSSHVYLALNFGMSAPLFRLCWTVPCGKGHMYRVLALEVFVDDLWYAVAMGLRKEVVSQLP